MSIKYSVSLEIHAFYNNEDVGELKDSYEYAEDLAHLICDEVATAGGVAFYKINKTSINNVT